MKDIELFKFSIEKGIENVWKGSLRRSNHVDCKG